MTLTHRFVWAAAATLFVAAPAFAAPGYLGVYLTDEARSDKGALIEDVAPRSPAARAGLRRGDRITSINGKAIANSAALIPHLTASQPGQVLNLRASRRGWERSFTVRLGDRSAVKEKKYTKPKQPAVKPAKERGFLGIYLEQNDGGDAIIESVMKGSAAQQGGLQEGDRITSVGGRIVTDPSAVITYLGQYGPGAKVKLGVKRGGSDMTITVTLGRRPSDKKGPAPEAKPAKPDPVPAPSAKRPAYVGVSLEDNNGRGPLKVDDVRANSPAERFGLRKGDVLVEVNGKATKTIEDFVKSLKGTYAGDTVTFKIERGGWKSNVRLTLGNRPKQ